MLLLSNPMVAIRDCGHCQEWNYDEDTGLVKIHHGQPVKRIKRIGPPCRGPAGCPKGTPENQRTLTNANANTYRHYRECRAVGVFPDDPIVRQNAVVILEVEEHHERMLRLKDMALLARRG